MKRLHLVTIKTLFYVSLGFIIILNLQPWIDLADNISKQITSVPLLSSVVRIPYLGGIVLWVFTHIDELLSITLWAVVQTVQILPLIICTYGATSVPPHVLKNLNTYRAVAYGIETVVCFLRFPPYEGGMEAISADFPNWNMALINWWNLLFFIITMLGFEMFVRAAFVILQSLQATSSSAEASQRPPYGARSSAEASQRL